MLPKLNEDQQRLAQENLPLVRWYLKTKMKYIPRGEYDDFFQIGAYGLCKAAVTFEPEAERRFSTYATICIANEVLMHLRKERKREEERFAPRLEATAPGHRQSDDTLADCIADIEDVESAMRLIELRQILKRCAKEREGKILVMYMRGYDQKTIARRFGMSQSMVSRKIKGARTSIREAMRREA